MNPASSASLTRPWHFPTAIYAGGAQDPHFNYTLKPEPSEGIRRKPGD